LVIEIWLRVFLRRGLQIGKINILCFLSPCLIRQDLMMQVSNLRINLEMVLFYAKSV